MPLFRVRDFTVLLSDTYDQAVEFLADIKVIVQDNDALIEYFEIEKVERASEDDLIVRHKDGYRWRIRARGAEQKIRGLKWRNKRPNHFLYDDVENDEIVMNPERREKFRRWVLRAVLPAGSSHALHRWVGTILHEDAMLARLMRDPEWFSLRFQAHKSMNDFRKILWPQQFDEARLRSIQEGFRAQGDLEGYSQEYLNQPVAEGNTYFRKQDFIGMTDDDRKAEKVYFATADFAISETEKADSTVIWVIGVCSNGYVHTVDLRKVKGDADEIIDELLSVQEKWDRIGKLTGGPGLVEWTFETEKIDKAIGPSLNRAMIRRGIFMSIRKVTPTKSKTTRGKSTQQLMKAGACKFDEHLDLYDEAVEELMMMTPGGPRGPHDDFFDAFAMAGMSVDRYYEGRTEEQAEEDDYEDEVEESYALAGGNPYTGY